MKKLISMLLALIMTLALCACGGTAVPAQDVNAEASSDAAEAEPAKEAAEENIAEASDWQSIYDEAAELYYVDYDYPAAFEKLQGAEKSENASALYLLGLCCYNGNGTEKDAAKGAELFTKAAELGSIDAKYYLANAYKTGSGVEVDSEKADELYRTFLTEAESAEPADTPEYGRMLYEITCCYIFGLGTKADAENAAKYAKMLLDSGNAGVLDTYSLAAGYESGKMGAENTGKAQKLYADIFPQVEALANKGISNAERYYAQYYQYGDGGVTQDYAKALEWYEKAAEQENSDAMNRIGILYANGAGVEQDYTKALEWYEKAAELGNDMAMNNLGVMYANGYGVEQDYTKALEWYEKAAELGNEKAAEYIANLRDQGLVS